MKTQTYIKTFSSHDAADDWMHMKNRACAAAGNRRDIYALVDHPEGYAVVDLATAIDLGGGYEWSC